ncbi:MAG TPA: glucose-1-phosphate adenylyltransferase [Thermotogota bacterium]|nr:glucose-1-phosphate adenylyltransferase [Thermotogota bacterium]NLH19401.1 glucose-1-phosphate adenylyltransferase [Thermotogaceae bacterium]OQC31185.1 MAG: Glucose-1-phosphate adenylyltransferase [Thermotogota bacterium ADurb.Bin062]HNW47216.1 glucose-1-phosphate adenylyltransferase [Thermotogota bacterium]HNY82821.1 glucose-1-phosphate adenylyltransferase [Thermotogota bacterium]
MASGITAMILAGGQGTRLGVLTEDIAKPAVPFGGKYRIIDFTLSNCVNSGIFRVGVLTQYKPHLLNAHIGIGRPWDLDRMGGGVTILQPYTYETGNIWFRGTADAIYENFYFIEKNDPKYVLILSGDHIYAMDYMDMLNYHVSKHAFATCACMNVPLAETSRYGIMVTDLQQKIVEFQEKPLHARSTLASLGIYIFNWDYLKALLKQDAAKEESTHDFGNDIIPEMVKNNADFYAYEFEGYWRDVGTLPSYWEANMELIQPLPPLSLYNPSWRFYTRTRERPPAYFGPEAVVLDTLVSEGSEVFGVVEKSVIFQSVTIAKGASIKNSVVLTGSVIEEGAEISNAIIAENATIGKGVRIGNKTFAPNREDPKVYNSLITTIGYNASVPDNTTIGSNCVVHSGVSKSDFEKGAYESGESVWKKEQRSNNT